MQARSVRCLPAANTTTAAQAAEDLCRIVGQAVSCLHREIPQEKHVRPGSFFAPPASSRGRHRPQKSRTHPTNEMTPHESFSPQHAHTRTLAYTHDHLPHRQAQVHKPTRSKSENGLDTRGSSQSKSDKQDHPAVGSLLRAREVSLGPTKMSTPIATLQRRTSACQVLQNCNKIQVRKSAKGQVPTVTKHTGRADKLSSRPAATRSWGR